MLTKKMFIFLFAVSVMASCTKDGEVGPAGQAGIEGAQGTAGIDGANGADGSQGAAGIDGVDGTDGADAPGSNIEVITDDTDIPIQGASSMMHRSIDGITVHFETTNLIPNNAYTLWFVVFGETPGPPISTFAAGHIAGETGTEIFSAFKAVDADFDNPMTGEIHLALRTHGPVQPGMILEQIQTMDGGCTSGFDSGPGLHADSETVGYCANVQVAKHLVAN